VEWFFISCAPRNDAVPIVIARDASTCGIVPLSAASRQQCIAADTLEKRGL
jgi:hypothetical protein